MTFRSWLAFVSLGIIWGFPYFFIKIAIAELSPFVVVWARLAMAALILLPIAWYRGALSGVGKYIRPIGAFTLAEFLIPFTAIAIGEQWVSSSVTGILMAMVPLSIALISRFFGLHEPLTASRLSGLILGFVGVASLLGFGTISGPLGWTGAGCMLLATVGYAIGPLIVQRHLKHLDSIGPIAISVTMASLALTAPALLTWPPAWPGAITVVSVAVLGVVCTAIAMLLMFYLISHAGAARATVITYINPMVAALLGVAVLGEHLGVGGGLAFVLILLGSWLSTRAAPRTKDPRNLGAKVQERAA